jgi:hypothetical protein
MSNLIDFTRPVQTVDGRNVRILCTDFDHGLYPVVASIPSIDEEYGPMLCRYSIYGIYEKGHCLKDSKCLNLVNVPVKREAWVIIRPGSDYVDSRLYKTQQDASFFIGVGRQQFGWHIAEVKWEE